jgi:hypothetical protein
MRNALIGLALAAGLALALAPVTIAGIDSWKVVLAAAGAFLFVTAGRNKSK